MISKLSSLLIFILIGCATVHAQIVQIGLNYPQTGPYSVQGEAQLKAAKMALEEINAQGGILGRKINLIVRDSKSKADVSKRNVEELIDKENCAMIFGGSSSAVAIEGGKAAKSRNTLYFGTLTYSNATTGKDGHLFMFRECYNAWMGAKALSHYLREKYLAGRKYFYITANYTWGWTTEKSIRKFSYTMNERRHQRVYTPFPGATEKDFISALKKAKLVKPDVLVLVLFGKDMAKALNLAYDMGIKDRVQAVVVPNLTLGMAESSGPKIMEGVIGALPWCWKVPYIYDYQKGKDFVEKFVRRYGNYPSTSAASAYTILYQYRDAVTRAGTFSTKAVIAALEDHKFTSLKDEQIWRKFDHQCLQTVYTVRCKSEEEVTRDKFKQDYFDIIATMDGVTAAKTKEEWIQERREAGMPLVLE
jgi:branched-chain amino acid transport system substrate-binding protein